jgi:hypothetical protein
MPDEAQLRRLAAWWRTCKGDDSFRTALEFCAGQLELALDGELRGFEVTTVYQGGKTPAWVTEIQRRHRESYIDSEGEERCVACDKRLEPGCYDIEDHFRAMSGGGNA